MTKTKIYQPVCLETLAKKLVIEELIQAAQYDLMLLINESTDLCLKSINYNPKEDEMKHSNLVGHRDFKCRETCASDLHTAQRYRVLLKNRIKALPVAYM